ncbi:thioredoxin-like domain-containing protein [Gallaecimonas kandeliae]|uniref:thioredoxin-like domain-containing protein n=1 Tax=Gallaecimonas kandeliae TaxID=3029055 RepID=UPI002648DA2C|nr:thioredoxin-like domain-containing protein [Gallaecimonas kandeliae]WKE65131.1 thioredoxin-like domain-containing protein [Gallaecimonas kandeliae]
MRILSLLLTLFLVTAQAQGREQAVPFGPELQWLNVEHPLTLDELKGKVVILDFWTYGCINCMHILPDLKKLEDKYGNKLAVISVHSPKFDNEKHIDTLRHIVARYGITHPVANDVEFSLWQQYGVRAWPTFVILTPDGQVVGQTSGEGRYPLLDKVVAALVDEFKGKFNEKPLPLKLIHFKDSPLAAPGKVRVRGDLVAISDSGHNRIVFARPDGKVVKVVGSGQACAKDGSSDSACFDSPQGSLFQGQALLVADTNNHLIRRIDLRNFRVSTVAGTGKLGSYLGGEGKALDTALRSPWDLAALPDGGVAIAMAGSHQIWQLKDGQLSVLAGSGREGLTDGTFPSAAFSQPSGLYADGDGLWEADPESSAIRHLDLAKQQVTTLVGKGLFDFGLKDGSFKDALLQHALGVIRWDDHRLLVADTYNHALRWLDLDKHSVSTMPLPEGTLNEPGGLARLGDQVLVADTNHDRLVLIDPSNNKVTTYNLKF